MTESELQQEAGRIVEQNVIYCVSTLIYELSNAVNINMERSEYFDDLLDLCRGVPDYEEAATQAGYEVYAERDANDPEVLLGFAYRLTVGAEAKWTTAESDDTYSTQDLAWKAACDDNNIEPYEWEVYEHWIVSGWFASKLEAKGHRVVRDFMGMTIWGRPTTGQAISMDGVVREIVRELHEEFA